MPVALKWAVVGTYFPKLMNRAVVAWPVMFVELTRLLVSPNCLGNTHLAMNRRRLFPRGQFEMLPRLAKRKFCYQARCATIALQGEIQLAIPKPEPIVAAELVGRIEDVEQSRATATALHFARRAAIALRGGVVCVELGPLCQLLNPRYSTLI
jgi:hypothetical protein